METRTPLLASPASLEYQEAAIKLSFPLSKPVIPWGNQSRVVKRYQESSLGLPPSSKAKTKTVWGQRRKTRMSKQNIEELCSQLDHENSKEVNYAIHQLGLLGEEAKAAVDRLVDLFYEAEPHVQKYILWAFGKIRHHSPNVLFCLDYGVELQNEDLFRYALWGLTELDWDAKQVFEHLVTWYKASPEKSDLSWFVMASQKILHSWNPSFTYFLSSLYQEDEYYSYFYIPFFVPQASQIIPELMERCQQAESLDERQAALFFLTKLYIHPRVFTPFRPKAWEQLLVQSDLDFRREVIQALRQIADSNENSPYSRPNSYLSQQVKLLDEFFFSFAGYEYEEFRLVDEVLQYALYKQIDPSLPVEPEAEDFFQFDWRERFSVLKVSEIPKLPEVPRSLIKDEEPLLKKEKEEFFEPPEERVRGITIGRDLSLDMEEVQEEEKEDFEAPMDFMLSEEAFGEAVDFEGEQIVEVEDREETRTGAPPEALFDLDDIAADGADYEAFELGAPVSDDLLDFFDPSSSTDLPTSTDSTIPDDLFGPSSSTDLPRSTDATIPDDLFDLDDVAFDLGAPPATGAPPPPIDAPGAGMPLEPPTGEMLISVEMEGGEAPETTTDEVLVKPVSAEVTEPVSEPVEAEPVEGELYRKKAKKQRKKAEVDLYELERGREWIFEPKFEKYLSDSAGCPGPMERFVAQFRIIMKGIQHTIGLRFLLIANAIDILIDLVTSYIRGIYQAWKMGKMIKRRLARRNPEALLGGVLEDIALCRIKLARIFAFVGFQSDQHQDRFLPEKEDVTSLTFALEIVIEVRGLMDDMKRDLSILTVKEAKEGAKQTTIGFLKSFIPNPLELFAGWKDVYILAFRMNYPRREVEKMYVKLVVGYSEMIDELRASSEWTEEQARQLDSYQLELTLFEEDLLLRLIQDEEDQKQERKSVEQYIQENREALQRVLQTLCNPAQFIYCQKWSRWDLLFEVKKLKDEDKFSPHVAWEWERWLREGAKEVLEQENIYPDSKEKERRWQEEQIFRRRYLCQRLLHKHFL